MEDFYWKAGMGDEEKVNEVLTRLQECDSLREFTTPFLDKEKDYVIATILSCEEGRNTIMRSIVYDGKLYEIEVKNVSSEEWRREYIEQLRKLRNSLIELRDTLLSGKPRSMLDRVVDEYFIQTFEKALENIDSEIQAMEG